MNKYPYSKDKIAIIILALRINSTNDFESYGLMIPLVFEL